MGSAQLRAAAMDVSQEAERLRDCARRVLARADEVPALLQGPRGRFGPDVWRGSSATRAGAQLDSQHGRLGGATADVTDAAERLMLEAQRLDQRAEGLGRQADPAHLREAREAQAAKQATGQPVP